MSNDDYEVGYQKPPKSTQFQPGQSGNPKGRPKGVKNLASDLEQELLQKIAVTEGGNEQLITKQHAMVKSMLAKAISGSARHAQVLISLIVGLEQARATEDAEVEHNKDDLEILNAFKTKLLLESKVSPTKPDIVPEGSIDE